MKKGRQKSKGNSYEIKIARIFSKWFCKNFEIEIHKDKNKDFFKWDYFWRTAGSGAKSTRGKSAQTSFVGDITFLPDPNRLQIWIDTKDVKNASFNSILSDRKFIIHEWYKAEVKKMKTIGAKKPVVIIFKFYKKKENYIFFNSKKITIGKYRSGNISIFWKHFTIMCLEDFLESVRKEKILK